ncbi:MAG: type VI secretion system baseplate subunit TssF [Nitrospirales bacterium]
MEDRLLHYYEQELTFLRKMGQEFSQEYPNVAGSLQLEAGKGEDPHVERLLEGFAFLAARIHHKLDDEFPELTNALLSILYPHFLAPVPSMSIVQFVPDPLQGKLTSGYTLEKGTLLYSRPVKGTQCRFRTCYPTTIWPLEVISAQLEPPDRLPLGVSAQSTIRITLQCQGGLTFQDLELDRLRFYLHGENLLAHAVYELLLNNALLLSEQCGVLVRGKLESGKTHTLELPPQSLQPVGFQEDEGLLPYTPRSFVGYRLLQEFFTFPKKFLFVDLLGLERVCQAGFGDTIDLIIPLDRVPHLDQSVDAGVFRLGCTPIVNLFEHIAEPIRIDHTQHEYRVIPDVRRQEAMEIYSINSVTCTSPNQELVEPVLPLYSLQHTALDAGKKTFWYAKRQPSERKDDEGTELYLSMVDLNFHPSQPGSDTLTLHTTCTNRDLPGRLPPLSDEGGYFELEGSAPLSRIRYLVKPTKTLRPPLGGGSQWRLISHLSLNYLSLLEGGEDAFREILKLYDYAGTASVRQQIAGITHVSSRSVVRRPTGMGWNGFCRGLEVTMTFDEEKYVGSSVFLFASVLEKFLALYTSLNSFVEMVARTTQREVPLRKWPPRAGNQILV